MKKSGVGTLRTLFLTTVILAGFSCQATAGRAQTPIVSPPSPAPSPAASPAAPATSAPASTSTTPPAASTTPTATGARLVRIGNETLHGVLELSKRFADPMAAAAVTAGNGYDQVYLKDDEGKGYVWFGKGPYMDSLIKPGYVGTITVPGSATPKTVTVVAVQNEINTASETTFDSWNDIKAIIQSQGRLVLQAASLTAGGLFFRQMILGGTFSLANVTGSLKSVLMLAVKYKWHALAAAGVTIGLPVAWNLLKFGLRAAFLEAQKDRPQTISMITVDPEHPDRPENEQVGRPIHLSPEQHRPMHWREWVSQLLLKTAVTTTTTTSPGVDPNPGVMGFGGHTVTPPRSPNGGRMPQVDGMPGFERLENR